MCVARRNLADGLAGVERFALTKIFYTCNMSQDFLAQHTKPRVPCSKHSSFIQTKKLDLHSCKHLGYHAVRKIKLALNWELCFVKKYVFTMDWWIKPFAQCITLEVLLVFGFFWQ